MIILLLCVPFIFALVDSHFSRFEEEIELQLAMGNLDIETLERIDDFNPHNSTTKVKCTENSPLKLKKNN